jgi:hypothetical protein
MCGIVGFVSNDAWLEPAPLDPFREIAASVSAAAIEPPTGPG